MKSDDGWPIRQVFRLQRYRSLAGDMWNELENLRSHWEGTDREPWALMLIEQYEKLVDAERADSE